MLTVIFLAADTAACWFSAVIGEDFNSLFVAGSWTRVMHPMGAEL